jgi:serine/threonine protein kinase
LSGGCDKILQWRQRDATIGARAHSHVGSRGTVYQRAASLVCHASRESNLSKAIRQGSLGPDEKVTIVNDLITAIQAAHRRDILHRDICPENILLGVDDVDGTQHAILADFDIAYVEHPLLSKNSTTGLPGHARYLPPEIFSGAGPQKLKTLLRRRENDVWAFGMVVFVLFSQDVEKSLPESRTAKDFMACFPASHLEQSKDLRFRRAAANLCEQILAVEPQKRLPRIDKAHFLWLQLSGAANNSSATSAAVVLLLLVNILIILDWFLGRATAQPFAQLATKITGFLLSAGALSIVGTWFHKSTIHASSRGRLAVDYFLNKTPARHGGAIVLLLASTIGLARMTELPSRRTSYWVTGGKECSLLRRDDTTGSDLNSDDPVRISVAGQFWTVQCPHGSVASIRGMSLLTPDVRIKYIESDSYAKSKSADRQIDMSTKRKDLYAKLHDHELSAFFSEPMLLEGKDLKDRRRIYRGHMAVVEGCYHQSRRVAARLEALSQLDLRIDGFGCVSTASVRGDSVDDVGLDTCVADALKKWKFSRTGNEHVVACTLMFTSHANVAT